ncbi:DUF6388 family protein [Chitinimonas sp.]|uniref:DUF6388 family protein n=1 Tax=Chitinimonas sp. TaxID=1934313 RepID=UPI0035B4B05B
METSDILLARHRFLERHPEVVSLLRAISPRHAGAAGLSLEAFQEQELDRAISKSARQQRLTTEQFLQQLLMD